MGPQDLLGALDEIVYVSDPNTYESVSYTHLSFRLVFQLRVECIAQAVLSCVGGFYQASHAFLLELHASGRSVHCTQTVSYTHLDVYKRQSLYSLSARAAECCARAFVKAVSDYSIFCVKDKMCCVHFNEL